MISNQMKKNQAKLVQGVPMAPLEDYEKQTGHGNLTIHPKLKHMLRLDIHDRASVPYFQTIFLQNVSVYINDAKEAARLLKSLVVKGPIYQAYRSSADTSVPDLFTSDNEEWKIRNENLRPALTNLKIKDSALESIMKNFASKLTEYSESSKPLDLISLCVSLAFDAISAAAFDYELEALKDSTDGISLVNCANTISDLNKSVGNNGLNVYYYPDARKVPQEEADIAKASFRGYISKLVNVIKTESEQYKVNNGQLNVNDNFGHALIDLASKHGEAFGEKEINAEVSQVVRHGYEMLSSQLTWLFYALYRHPQVRAKLELEVFNHTSTPSDPYPEYLECVIKETLRRYPAAGNFTARTVGEKGLEFKGSLPASAPAGTLVQIHMFSLHNTTKLWGENPLEFNPDRWLKDSIIAPASAPRCPFLSAKAAAVDGDAIYDGVGFAPGTLAYFPFSGGARSCPGKGLTLTIMREVLKRTVTKFRLSATNPTEEEDLGHQTSTSFGVCDKQNTTVKVTRITNASIGVEEAVVPKKVEKPKEEGWADPDEEDEQPTLIVKPTDDDDDDEVPDLVDGKN